jgi:two-component system, sensor histidine kinase RegB
MRAPRAQMATVEAAATTPVPHQATTRGVESRVERSRLNLSWLIQLHWWAIIGQVVIVIGASSWTSIGVPLVPFAVIVALEVAGNFALRAWVQRAVPQVRTAGVAAVMFIDTAVLTVLLDLTGGASNPFSTLYLVNVALGAVLLPSRWSWTLMVAALAGFATLYFHEEATSPAHHIHTQMDAVQMLDSHLRGMWIAFAIAAVFIVFFIQRVSRALASRERELREARVLVERREKLASLATLAAGAAHELSTPLSTIAVVAKELQRSLPDVPAEVRGDLQLVREQVGRCRDILDRMSANAGEHAGEPLASMTVRAWAENALDGLPARDRVELAIEEAALEAHLVGPPRALGDALRGLLKNGIQASPDAERVTLAVEVREAWIRARVVDRGRGMTAEVLRRVGEPFFTTKSPGEGMGLGLFLTRALIEQLGGQFHITSRPGVGTEACIDLPAADAA